MNKRNCDPMILCVRKTLSITWKLPGLPAIHRRQERNLCGNRTLETATNSMANATCLVWRRKQLLGVRGLATKAGAPSLIFIPSASTQGPPTSSAVQVNQGEFHRGLFHRETSRQPS